MRRSGVFGLVVAFVLVARAAMAQNGAIIGTVTDATGALLPGVTVEASSPALIEGSRATTTNDQGLYRIIDLRPGIYNVTFTLVGFQTLKRESVELSTSFTATINASLALGTLSEAVTVTSEAPLVDTVNVTAQDVIKRDVLEAVPIGSNIGTLRTLVPGAVGTDSAAQDVGGNQGERRQGFGINGLHEGDFQLLSDGMLINNLLAAGNASSSPNPAMMQEVVVTTGGFGATAQTGGATVNVVQREGGNTWTGNFSTNFTNDSLRSSNLTEALRARAAQTEPGIRSRRDTSGGIGGPIVKNKLWFFAASRYWITSSYQAGNFFNATQGSPLYTPDPNKPAYELNTYASAQSKVTWQATQKQKFTGTYFFERNCNCFFLITNGTLSPEAAGSNRNNPDYRIQGTYTYPVTDKLLLWAGMTEQMIRNNKTTEGSILTENQRSILDLTRNYRYGAPGGSLTSPNGSYGHQDDELRNQNFTMSYLTGGHYLKVGFTTLQGLRSANRSIFEDMSFQFRNGLPAAVDLYATPYIWGPAHSNQYSVFGEDQWKFNRLSLNLGLRYDGMRGWVPAQDMPAGRFVPARHFDKASGLPVWNDLNPRVGVAYDVFGKGRTALKASIARSSQFVGNINQYVNPVANMVSMATRTWSDNGDFIPQENELGPLSNAAFGTVRANTTYAPDVLKGWNTRPSTMAASVLIEHQLNSKVSFTGGYFRTSFGNFTLTDNLAVAPTDYDQDRITAPQDTRLPGGGGQQICGLYDLSPAKFGQVSNSVVKASTFGKQTEVYNGISLSVDARTKLYTLGGGLTSGHTVTDRCFVVDSPQEKRFCHSSPPWSASTQLKLYGIAQLPANLQASAAFQMLPSIPLLASYVYNNTAVQGLGRSLSGGATSTRTIDLIEPNKEFAEPWNTQIDVRLSYNYKVGRAKIQPQFDIFNLLNSNAVLVTTTRFGPAWQNVAGVLGSRVIKLGGRFDF